MENKSEFLLEMKHIEKKFGAIVALSDGYIHAKPGEVNALVGGNGAGKSTLIKILSGAQPHDGGEIIFNGNPVHIKSTNDALNIGIKTIYQELALFDQMNVYENLFVGREMIYENPLIKWMKVMRRKDMAAYARNEINRMGLNIPDIFARVRTMSGGQRQCISCARALLGGEPAVLVMDEPTAALGVKESMEVLDMMKKYRDQGAAIILISHNMRTVFEVANEITVMRLGETICNVKKDDVTEEEIVGLMTGAIERLDASRDFMQQMTDY